MLMESKMADGKDLEWDGEVDEIVRFLTHIPHNLLVSV